MDGLLQAHKQQEAKGNLAQAIQDAQKLIDLLQGARDAAAAEPTTAPLQAAKLKKPTEQAFSKLDNDLKEINKTLNSYQKALKEKFKNTTLPSSFNEALAHQPDLVNRAIAMHLLREGKFDIANTFVKEVQQLQAPPRDADGRSEISRSWIEDLADADDIMSDDQEEGEGGGNTHPRQGGLQKKFAEMYHILDALRNQHNLEPAIAWAREHSAELENRGSNLEFELSRLKFVELYTTEDIMSDTTFDGPIRALQYAREVFPAFSSRYARETASLLGSLAFYKDLRSSPYDTLFYDRHAYEQASTSFTREFCGMLGLSSNSPLYTAVTAGGIALPRLEKVERVMAQHRGQWTSVNELPVETPLPPGFQFHSIFVCPVSKEQATDANPPMMLPCGHVIAKESLEQHSRGKQKMKCPYCPNECAPKDARRVYI